MVSFTIELVSNASSELFRDFTLSSFNNFLPDQVNLEGQWEVAFSEISYPSLYQNVTDEKFPFYDAIFSRTTTAYSLEHGLYSSVPNIVEAVNLLMQERNKHNEICITVKVSRRTQKIELSLSGDDSSLVIFSTDLGIIFGGDFGDDKGILMRGKGPHEPKFAYDFVRIHSLMIYIDIVEYNIAGDTKEPLLRCFPLIFKLKSGDVITTGQCMKNPFIVYILI